MPAFFVRHPIFVRKGESTVIRTIHERRPPEQLDVAALLERLVAHEVRYVVTGSVAACLHGVETTPGDFDVTPATDVENLGRLAAVLNEVEATPENLGRWESKDDGGLRWVEETDDPETLAAWQPDVDRFESFDHLYHTRFGNFDVVPRLAGSYETLRDTATEKKYQGLSIPVAHVDDLLAGITVPRRPKDVPRVEQLREIQRRERTSR